MANPIDKPQSKNGRSPAVVALESSQQSPACEVRAETFYTTVTAERVINLILPSDFPIGPVEVIVIFKVK